MTPNNDYNYAATSADTSVEPKIGNTNATESTTIPQQAEGASADSKPPANTSHSATASQTLSHINASEKQEAETTASSDPLNAQNQYFSFHGKRKLPSSNTIGEPDTEAGLELLFAASLIQQKGEEKTSKQQTTAKAISSCSENDSTMGDSPLHNSAEFTESNEVVLPTEKDVLMGRGGRVNQHVGNVVYRKVVDYNKAIYKQVPKRHRILVSQSIVQTIEKHGGRFLQPVNGNQNQQAWKCIHFRRAVQKTSQALREPSTDSADPSAASGSVASETSK